MGVALHERVDEGQCHAAKGQPEREAVGEENDHQEGDQAEPEEQGNGLTGQDAAGCQGALPCAFHMAVEVAVGVVVDDASRGAHEENAEGKDHQVCQAWNAFSREPEGPPGGPEQQQAADRPVDPHQLYEIRQALTHPVQCRLKACRRHGSLSITARD